MKLKPTRMQEAKVKLQKPEKTSRNGWLRCTYYKIVEKRKRNRNVVKLVGSFQPFLAAVNALPQRIHQHFTAKRKFWPLKVPHMEDKRFPIVNFQRK